MPRIMNGVPLSEEGTTYQHSLDTKPLALIEQKGYSNQFWHKHKPLLLYFTDSNTTNIKNQLMMAVQILTLGDAGNASASADSSETMPALLRLVDVIGSATSMESMSQLVTELYTVVAEGVFRRNADAEWGVTSNLRIDKVLQELLTEVFHAEVTASATTDVMYRSHVPLDPYDFNVESQLSIIRYQHRFTSKYAFVSTNTGTGKIVIQRTHQLPSFDGDTELSTWLRRSLYEALPRFVNNVVFAAREIVFFVECTNVLPATLLLADVVQQMGTDTFTAKVVEADIEINSMPESSVAATLSPSNELDKFKVITVENPVYKLQWQLLKAWEGRDETLVWIRDDEQGVVYEKGRDSFLLDLIFDCASGRRRCAGSDCITCRATRTVSCGYVLLTPTSAARGSSAGGASESKELGVEEVLVEEEITEEAEESTETNYEEVIGQLCTGILSNDDDVTLEELQALIPVLINLMEEKMKK